MKWKQRFRVSNIILHLLITLGLLGLPSASRGYEILTESNGWNDPVSIIKSATMYSPISNTLIEYDLSVDFTTVVIIPSEFHQPISMTLLTSKPQLPDTESFTATAIRTVENWGHVILVPTYVIEDKWEHDLNSKEVVEVLLRRDNAGTWHAATKGTVLFAELARNVPPDFIDFSNLYTLSGPRAILADYLFPWTKGQDWYKTNGWHGGNAIDFQPVLRSEPSVHFAVLAASTGRLTRICGGPGTNDIYQTTLQIEHDDGITRYLHLDANSIRQELLGKIVERGQFLGLLYNGTQGGGNGNQYNTPCGYGTAFHLHFVLPKRDMSINGANTNNIANSPWATKYSSSNQRIDSSNNEENHPPDSPSLSSPSDLHIANDGHAPTLCWNNPRDPEGDQLQFYAEIYDSPRNAQSAWRSSKCWRPGDLDGHYHTYKWRVKARDSKGAESSWSETRHFSIKQPNQSPSINFVSANGNNANQINSRDQNWTFTGSASDPESRLDRIEFRCSGDGCGSGSDRTNGSNWSLIRTGMTGKNDVYFRACDEEQCTDSRHLDLNIDLAPPTTKASIEEEKEGEWYHGAVNVRLRSDDGSTGRARVGVKEIRYRVDGGGWQAQSGDFTTVTINTDGNHTVEYYAVDHLDNQEAAKTISFKLDATPPTPISGLSESNGTNSDQWQKAKNVPAFTWAASSDNLSGLWGYQFYFGEEPNGEAYQSFRAVAEQPREWTPLPGGVRTATYYLRGRTRDIAGNFSPWATLFIYRYDGTVPENPETAIHAGGVTNDTWQRTTSQPNFTWPVPHDEGSGIKGYSIYWGDDPNGETANFSANAGYQSATPLCATNAACTGYLRVRSVDNVDNQADRWASVFTVRYDGAPPVADFTINGGVTQTNQTQIVLTLNASDQGSGVHAMRFSNDGVNWTAWEAYATERIWQIPAIGRQSWPVYVQVQDNVGLESAVVSRTTYFEVNRAQPRSEGFRLFNYGSSAGAGAHASASFQGRSTVGQAVDAAQIGSDNYRINGGYEAGSQAIPLIVPGHDTFLFINGIFASGIVANTMQSGSFRMIGTLGEVALPNNVTTLSSNSFQHQPGFLAAAPSGQPVIPAMATPEPGPTPIPLPTPDCEFPQVSINNATIFTNNVNVTLSLCAPRAVQMIVSNDGGFSGSQWEPYARSKAWTLTTHGQNVLPRYVYVAFRDVNGTIYSTYMDDIIHDPTPPNGTMAVGDSISTEQLLQSAAGMNVQAASADMFEVDGTVFLRQINSQALASPLALRSLNAAGVVDIFFNAQDENSGIREMQISANAEFSDTGWENYSALRPWNPTEGDGVKTIYARFRDSAGNVSVATNASFALDTQPPLGGIGVVDSIIGLNTVTVTLYLQAEDNLSGVADMRISSDDAFANALWQPFADNVVWSVYPDAQQNTGTFYVQFRDQAGNVSQSYSTEYLLDTQPPILYVEVDPGETLERTVRVYAYDELSALRTLSISNDPLLIEGVTTQAYSETIPWTFDERQVVWLQVTDSIGNTSEPYPAYAALPDAPTPTPSSTPTVGPGDPTPTPDIPTPSPGDPHIYLPLINR